MTEGTKGVAMEHHRLAMHLNLLEKDATHPLDFKVDASNTAPALVLRAGQSLRSAHSDIALDYEVLRQLLMETLRTRINELEVQLGGTEGGKLTIEKLQFGDQTEA